MNITLLSSKEVVLKPKVGEGTNLLSRVQFEYEVTKMKIFYVLITKEGMKVERREVTKQIRPLLQEFMDVFL